MNGQFNQEARVEYQQRFPQFIDPESELVSYQGERVPTRNGSKLQSPMSRESQIINRIVFQAQYPDCKPKPQINEVSKILA